MAILFMDGFDVYGTASDVLLANWTRGNTAAIFSTTAGRYGGGCLSYTADDSFWTRSVTISGSTIYLSGAFKWTALPATDILLRVYYGIVDSNNDSVILRLNGTSSDIEILPVGSTVNLATTTGGPLTSGVWHWISIKLTISNTGNCTIYVDGTEVLNHDSDYLDSAAFDPDIFCFFYAPDNGGQWDDIVINDDSGSTNNSFIPDSKIETLLPNGNGGVANWLTTTSTANYLAIDDAIGASNDGDTTFIYGSTAGQENRAAIGSLASTPDSIYAVQVVTEARKSDVGSASFRNLINSNSVESLGTTISPTTAYTYYRTVYNTDPGSTAGTWTSSAIDALQIGVEIV